MSKLQRNLGKLFSQFRRIAPLSPFVSGIPSFFERITPFRPVDTGPLSFANPCLRLEGAPAWWLSTICGCYPSNFCNDVVAHKA